MLHRSASVVFPKRDAGLSLASQWLLSDRWSGFSVLTEWLNPAAFGELALGMTLATLVNQTVLGPLGGGVMRFYAPAVEQGDLEGYLKSVRRLVLSATGTIVLVILLTSHRSVHHRARGMDCDINCSFRICHSERLQLDPQPYSECRPPEIHCGATSGNRIPGGAYLVAVGSMVLLGATSTVAMVGYALAVLLVLGSQSVFFSKVFPRRSARIRQGNKLGKADVEFFLAHFHLWSFTWAQLVSDRWALELFSTTQDVGAVCSAFSIRVLPHEWQPTAYRFKLMAPIFYQRAGDASDSRRSDAVSNLSWRLTGITIGTTGNCLFGSFSVSRAGISGFLSQPNTHPYPICCPG